jgi:alpha-mannosidase
LINESKYGYDAVGNTLRLSLLRSPVSPDPDADRGHHHFSYALYPHAGDWKQGMSVAHGYEFNYGLEATQVQSHSGILPKDYSFVSMGADDVILTALKKAEDADALIVRFYEWAGKNGTVRIKLPKGVTSVRLTNLMEQPEGAPLPIEDGGIVVVPVHPYEIVTLEATYPAHRS